MSDSFEITIQKLDNGWTVKFFREALLGCRIERKVYLDKEAMLMDIRGCL